MAYFCVCTPYIIGNTWTWLAQWHALNGRHTANTSYIGENISDYPKHMGIVFEGEKFFMGLA